MGIPIVIGVTGHRALRAQDLSSLRAAVLNELNQLMETYSDSSFLMLNSIASGADTLCAEVALSLGMRLVCPLPMPIDGYRKDFSEADARWFDALVDQAEDVFVTPDIEAAHQSLTRDDRYRLAGQYVAAHCHVLLALWDGSPAKPNGCGTAETVDLMLHANNEIGLGSFKASNDGAVLHILTPQDGSEVEIKTPEVHLLENAQGCLRETLITINGFNADSQQHADAANPTDSLVPDDVLIRMDDGMQQMHGVYRAADQLSLWFQSRYLRAMKLFSIVGALLVLFFLLYDEMESNLFLICYGVLIIIYALAFLRVRRGQAHEKYLRYRMLSEALRAQFYLRAAGMEDNITNAFTWTQKRESTWIKHAVSALLIGQPGSRNSSDDAIKSMWIDKQLAYHQNAFRRTSLKQRIVGRTATWMLCASIAVFVLVLVLEFLFDASMTVTVFNRPAPAFLMYHNGQTIQFRNLMKIVLGVFSVVTVFVANYFGKISLGRRSMDHERMAHLYATAKEKYESGQVDHHQIFLALAREEIIEIGNWFSYSRENAPSFQT